jgi:hypothetical protein
LVREDEKRKPIRFVRCGGIGRVFFWGERDWWWLLTSSKRIVPDNIIMMRTRSYFLSKLDVYHPRIEDQGQHTKPNAP